MSIFERIVLTKIIVFADTDYIDVNVWIFEGEETEKTRKHFASNGRAQNQSHRPLSVALEYRWNRWGQGTVDLIPFMFSVKKQGNDQIRRQNTF